MKFTIISGSPKGSNSVTLQYLLYIEKHYKEHEFEIFHVGQRIRAIEKNDEKFYEIIDSIKNSDGVFFITPIFYFLIPCQLKRFIELIFEKKAAHVFKGKYAAAVSTSIRFFDTTAHNYLHAVCDDLEMKYIGFNSLDMWDIFEKSKREQFLFFAEIFFKAIEEKQPAAISYPPLDKNKIIDYQPVTEDEKINSFDKNIVVLTDGYDENTNLGKMIMRFEGCFTDKIKIFRISDIHIKGGCLSCLKCGYDNKCIYKDGFVDFWRETMKKADIIIFAGSVKDRYLSSDFKMIFDRSFFMNHTPFLTAKQIGFLISGPLGGNENLKNLFSAYVESQKSNLVDFISDESSDSITLDRLIHNMAKKAVEMSSKGYIRPHTFYKEGGMKVFRDDVYGRLRFVCQADHRWYKANGIYDTFPQKNRFVKKMNRKLMFLTRFKKIREKVYKNIEKEMVKPIRKVALDPEK